MELREKNRNSAWAAFQKKIASNLHILIPFAISLKEATSLLREIEEFMKNDAGATTASPAEATANWLNAGVEGRAN